MEIGIWQLRDAMNTVIGVTRKIPERRGDQVF
jgi:hypothetical protein